MTGETTQKANLNQILEAVNELTRTIRGHNGTHGVVTQLALLQQDISSVKTTVEDVKKSIQTINENGCSRGHFLDQSVLGPAEPEPVRSIVEKPKLTSGQFFKEKILGPVLVALIVAFIFALPDIILAFDRLMTTPTP